MADYGFEPPHSNVFVRNLPPEIDHFSVEAMFGVYGKVLSCEFVKGAPIPFAFVKFESIESAKACVIQSNGTFIEGRQIMVKFADSDSQQDQPNNNLYVRNVPASWNEETVREHFGAFGSIVSVRLLPMSEGAHLQNALVRMSTVEEAAQAKNTLHKTPPPGEPNPLYIKYAETPENKARRASKSHRPQQRYAPYPTHGASGGQNNFMDPYDPLGAGYQAPSATNFGMGGGSLNAEPFGGLNNQMFQPPPPSRGGGRSSSSLPWHSGTAGAGAGNTNQLPSYDGRMPSDLASHFVPAIGQQANNHHLGQSTTNVGLRHGNSSAFGQTPAIAVVTGLPPTFDELQAYRHFASFGAVMQITVMPDGPMRPATARISYADATFAWSCMEAMNGSMIGSNRISVAVLP